MVTSIPRHLYDLAAFLTMSVVGISALLRAKATPEQMYAASRGVLTVLKPAEAA